MSSTKSLKPHVHEDIINYVKKCMKAFECGAHDYHHVARVANLALKIAHEEKETSVEHLDINMTVVYVGALFHDMLDSKLVDDGDLVQLERELREMLDKKMGSDWNSSHTDQVMTIVKSVGYKNLIKEDWKPQEMSIEYRCVQDADTLDAIGSIGISRCFAFNGKRKRPMFDMVDASTTKLTAEEYKARQGSALEHFYDKLLRIKELMTTPTGTAMARKRHALMTQFIEGLNEEIEDGACMEDEDDIFGNIPKLSRKSLEMYKL